MIINFPHMYIAVSKITGEVIPLYFSNARANMQSLLGAIGNSIWVEDHEAFYRCSFESTAYQGKGLKVRELRALNYQPSEVVSEAFIKQWKMKLQRMIDLTPWDEVQSIQFFKVTEEGLVEVNHKGEDLKND